MSVTADAGLRQRLAELISAATGGDVRIDDVLGGTSILNLGVDSLGMLRLVDAIELEWGVEVEFDDPDHHIETVDDLVALVSAATGSA
jgi:acyl carrier protein